MVVNLPDLGLTPLGVMSGNAAGLSDLSSIYNSNLALGLDYLESMGVDTIRLDSAGLLQAIVADPLDYGVSNAGDPYQFTTGEDPSGFLFWDLLHPTTLGHSLVAEEAMRVLVENLHHAWATPRVGLR
jgi:phospholipase/lecithinase/hemolysin